MKVLDISEPDFCTYQIKVATKYLCNAGAQMPKISSRFDPLRMNLRDKNAELVMDEKNKTQRRMIDCKIV